MDTGSLRGDGRAGFGIVDSDHEPELRATSLACGPGPGCFSGGMTGWTQLGVTATFKPATDGTEFRVPIPDGSQVAAVGFSGCLGLLGRPERNLATDEHGSTRIRELPGSDHVGRDLLVGPLRIHTAGAIGRRRAATKTALELGGWLPHGDGRAGLRRKSADRKR
jgi:hypothetical protein